MAHQPVGAGFSFATNQTSASQTFTVQSDTLRVVAKNAGQHVAIGTTGPATTTDYYVPANSSATLNLGRVVLSELLELQRELQQSLHSQREWVIHSKLMM